MSEISFNFEPDLVDYSKKMDLIKLKELPSFVYEYLQTLKTNLTNKTQNLNEYLFLADVLIDYSHEMLNTNLWVFVDEIWRYIYGFATLYKIIYTSLEAALANSVNKNNDLEESIIKLCDLGLLMSGPLLEKQFNHIINFFRKKHQVFKSKIRDDDENSSELESKLRKFNSKEFLLNEKCLINVEDSPSVEYLYEKYISTKTPVIIDNQMSHWPAVSKWK
jgi:hypothetical protein